MADDKPGPVESEHRRPPAVTKLKSLISADKTKGMDGMEFRKRGREMVDYIVDYLDNIDARRVTPNIEPGYLQDLIPQKPPENPEDWDDIMDDVEKKIMVGVSIDKTGKIVQL